jgi:CO/xanthine dehydrogenase Mo-binding subunit
MKSSVIGQNIPRVEGRSKVSGACAYSADVALPGALWGGFLHGPWPHARILNIDVSRARRVAGVTAVITGKDVPPRLYGVGLEDKPVLARDRVRYIGERVAGVVAGDKDTLEEALGLIEIEYDELPAVFDPLEAIKPDAPLLHPDYPSYQGPNRCADPRLKNIQGVQRAGKGNIEEGFAQADEIFENSFRTQMVHQAFIAPRACVIEIDPGGRVGVWTSNQSSFRVRKALATYAAIPEETITVHAVSVGGSFGGKIDYEEVLCTYYLARAAGKPVKFVETYSDELMDGQPRHPSVVVLRTGVKRDGSLCAWHGTVYYNGGAYSARNSRNALNGTFLSAGTYRTPHVLMEGYLIYTNQVPTGYYRAPGEVQTLFAVESHMDMMAEALGLDPLEFRLRNALSEGDTKPNGELIREPHATDVLQEVARLSGWKKSKAKSSCLPMRRLPAPRQAGTQTGPTVLTGLGIALGDRHIGAGESNIELTVEPDGSLRLATSVRDVGVGTYTMHTQVAAEVLGIDPNLIRIDVHGTEGPYDEGVRAQRGTHVEGQAVLNAAASLVERLRREAASHWKVGVDCVQWKSGRAQLKGSKKSLYLKEIARLSPNGSLSASGHFKGERPEVYAFQAMAAEVEVDRETGQVDLKHIYFAVDATKIINPIAYHGQIQGSVMQGIGFSLMENLATEDGRVTTLSLGDYKVPNIRDIPALTVSTVKANEGPGPFGAKAVAESGIGVVTPAIANAVYNATGVRIKELPITSEKILEGLKEKPSS